MTTSTAERQEFAPPSVNGHGRALVLAVLAHLVLLGGLTLGVQWKRSVPDTLVEAELWSAIANPAAPKLVEPAPAKPAPKRAPAAKVVPPGPSEADIALEREKARREKEKLALEKQRAAQLLEQQKREQEKRDKEKLALEKKREQEQQLAAEKKKREEQARLQEEETKRQQALKAEQAAKKAQLEAQQAREEAARLEAQRQDNLARIAGLAGATGPATATGTAIRASGPSSSYAGRVSASVKPNIVFTETGADNPTALVEVRAKSDGTIEGRKLLKSSGNPAWDNAVLKAIDKTAVLPRDVDGSVPPVLEINFRRRD